jgi:hypothetical protein
MHVKAETTNSMLMSFQRNVAQNHNTESAIISFDCGEVRIFGKPKLLAQSKGRLNLWTASYYLVANLVYPLAI